MRGLDAEPPTAGTGEPPRGTLFAGIDEAGLGPILGPLTFGFSVFRAPSHAVNLWRALTPVVRKSPRGDPKAFVVADSKVVFTRNRRGEERLERTALGFLALLSGERRPPDAGGLLWRTPAELGPPPEVVAEHPWYADLAALPRALEAGALELSVERLHRRMRARDVELVDAGVRVVPVAALNRSFEATANKGATHWDASRAILRYLWERHASGRLRVVVDRHGGRFHYAPLLVEAFPEATVTELGARPDLSEYRVVERGADPEAGPGRRLSLVFAERAENRSFAVSLASCLAKYARETAMDAFNRYFGALQPGLDPTAGYTTDGRRWLDEAAPALAASGVDRARLVRAR